MDISRFSSWKVCAIALVLGSCGTAHARNLARVAIPVEDTLHDPLYVDMDTVQWNGAVVGFNYVLDVPLLGTAGSEPRFRSHEIEAKIDCTAKTISVGDLIAYSGRAATGDMIFGQVTTAEDKLPTKIDMRMHSTYGYLFRHLCERARKGAKRSN